MTKISIITATYNSGATIRDTMESVLSQNYPDFEQIIVDGASTDNTLDIIAELEPRYKGSLKWVSESDKGIYDAMNKGIAMATGDVIGILNSDDFYTEPGVLSKVAIAFNEDGLDAVYGDIHFVDCDDINHSVRYYSSRSFARWQMLFGIQPAHPSFYCRKSIYERHGDFDTSFPVASDFEHLLRLIYINKIRTRYLPFDFVTMRTGGASTNGLRSHLRIQRDHYMAYRKHGMVMAQLFDWLRYPIKIVRLIQH